MAKILTFRAGELQRQDGGGACGGVSCEVIIFPGIRYERWSEVRSADEPVASATKAQPSYRRRDVLELAE